LTTCDEYLSRESQELDEEAVEILPPPRRSIVADRK
jgi:hypothetical protein